MKNNINIILLGLVFAVIVFVSLYSVFQTKETTELSNGIYMKDGLVDGFYAFPFPQDIEIHESSSISDDGGVHHNVYFESSMTLDDLTDWYKAELENSGWTLDELASELESKHERSGIFNKDKMRVGVDFDEEEDGTEVIINLTVSK